MIYQDLYLQVKVSTSANTSNFSNTDISVYCFSTGSKWLSAIGLTVTVDVQSVRAAASFSSVAGAIHVTLSISVRSDSSTVGEAITTILNLLESGQRNHELELDLQHSSANSRPARM